MMTIKRPRVYNLPMTLIAAVAAQDRIIVVGDSKAVDLDDAQKVMSVPKLYAMGDRCVAAISGWRLENPQQFMETAAANVTINNLQDVNEIAEYLSKLIKASRKSWAENDEAYLYVLLAGYSNSSPKIRAIVGEGLDGHNCYAYSLGSWQANPYIYGCIKQRPPELIGFRDAEQIAIRALIKGEKAKPDEIGQETALWHVFPDKAEKKSVEYVVRLRKLHGRGVK